MALSWYLKQGVQDMDTYQVEGMGEGKVKKILAESYMENPT